MSIGVQDMQGKLKKIARLVILRAALFGLKGLKRDEISLKIILYHLVCYVNVINKVLVGTFGEIKIKTKAYIASFGNFFEDDLSREARLRSLQFLDQIKHRHQQKGQI